MSGLYRPPAFAVDDRAEILAMARHRSFGHLVTGPSGADPPARLQATAVPFLIDERLTLVRAHLSRGNRHWRSLDGSDALLIVPGADAYVSPRWYPSRAAGADVVPTWNYELLHLHGRVELNDDPTWKRSLVGELTERYEADLGDEADDPAWHVDDASPDFVDKMVQAIVGVILHVTEVEAKRKLSQNRPAADQRAVTAALGRSTDPGDQRTAAVMARLPPRTTD